MMSHAARSRTIRRARAVLRTRRGIASVLSMMFLVLFGSLAAAMAIASRGNIRTAATHLHVTRAVSAAETGLAIAHARINEAASRFVIARSQIDADTASDVWNGDLSGVGSYTRLAPPSGYAENSLPAGIAQALANHHAADQNVITNASVNAPVITGAPTWASADFATQGWVFTPAVGFESRTSGDLSAPVGYSIIYAPLANGTDIRAIVTGYDFNQTRSGQPVTRTISQDFRLAKRVDHAIISPSRVLIGKNVLITGDMGIRYNTVEATNGDPLVIRSDFLGLNANLDRKLNDLFAALRNSDVDKDNRLRLGHPVEGAGVPLNADYNNDGIPDGAFADATQDGFVDEADVFIRHFDQNGDGRVVLSSALTAGTPADGESPEFTVDDDLALLIDSAYPDRNRNGLFGFIDANANGRWDSGESMVDHDPVTTRNRDQVLGYRDGVIDKRDLYAKVRGKLVFSTTSQAWSAAQGDFSGKLRGPLRPGDGQPPVTFGANDTELPSIDANSFVDSEAELRAAADGRAFWDQVASELGVAASALPTYTETKAPGTPRYYRVDPDANLDGLPDNHASAYFEKMPFNSPTFTDVYFRPVFENMNFKNVEIPLGLNALFRNCTFAGATYVRTTSGNNHVLWSEYGKHRIDPATGRPVPAIPRIIYGNDAGETSYPSMLPSTAIPPNQMILMAPLSTPLDKADVPANQVAGLQGYDTLPDPLIIGGRRVTDTKAFSNNLRFHDCLFVGSIVSEKPGTFTQGRNKIQFTGATRFATEHPTQPTNPALNPDSDDLAAILKSSMMLPNYSVDIGSFNSPQTQNVNLQGAIIAGVLDARGNTTIDGVLMLTFAPVAGQGPMRDSLGNPIGNPANFNASLGYFGPDDGDSESIDPNTLPLVGGVRIVGWDLNADGLPDLGPQETPTAAQFAAGAVSVPFAGYGRIELRMNPSMILPNGVMLPLRADPLAATYREGQPW